jgi:hypothetical protein
LYVFPGVDINFYGMLRAGVLATIEAPLHRQILIDGFTASDKTAAPMFPLYENPSDWDEYGEVINPDDYVVKETELMDYQNSQPVCFQSILLCCLIISFIAQSGS